MTGDPRKERDALDRLADALVDDVLNASDEDILAELTEEHGKSARLAAEVRALFERTALQAGKVKLATAKQAAAEAPAKAPRAQHRPRRSKAPL